MKKRSIILRSASLGLAIIGGYIGYSYAQTEHDIATYAQNVIAVADKHPSPEMSSHHLQKTHISHLPEPVQAYFNYVFPKGAPSFKTVKFAMQGQFRRPLTETFESTSAEQTIAVATPALVFSATTPIVPLIWAKAYDAYIDGEMDMKAKILSTVTVMEERETPELNRISLRRWLIESPVYPMALLPGGPVRWQAIDDKSARAIISAHGQTASMVATFRPDGSLQSFMAEEDGDLTTPYHGSGEYVSRSDYRLIGDVRVPHGFTIARASQGKIYPFWKGTITDISFQ
ncbi:MAG: hypothetical protein OIF58_16620 [Cohaesibacter sp.]|nr:hypothetical protein [Cohaesibacter sp.]